MNRRNTVKWLVWGGLLLGACLSTGCAKLSGVEPTAVTSKEKAPAPQSQQVRPGIPAASDPATLLSYKTGVARDKVEEILAIYQANAKEADSGRDIYKIALFAGEKTGVPTSQVGSVILSYKALGGDQTIAEAPPSKPEPKKG